MEIAFGVYDRPLDPPALKSVVAAALRRTDRYVWLYAGSVALWKGHNPGAPPVPAEYLAALRAARR